MQKKDHQIVIDIRGQICPSCLLITLKEVTANVELIKAGQATLKVITDDRHAITTIPDSVKAMGLNTEVSKSQDVYEILIFKE